MNVDRDATTTPVPDETIVRAVLRALIARLLPAVPALRAVTAHRVETAPARLVVRARTRNVMVQRLAVMVQRLAAKAATKAVMALRAVMVLVLRAAMAQLLVAKAATRAEMARRAETTAVPVGAVSRSALVQGVTVPIASPTIARGTTPPRSPKRSRPTTCTRRRAMS
ncbi:MAG: hypothetical protein Q8Q19_16095 [Microbacterium sp.]|nr:hypothetical protein [Microbacterium sp.]